MDTKTKSLAEGLRRVKENHYWTRRDLILSLAGLVVIGLSAATIVLSEKISRDENILPQVTIAGVQVGDLTKEEASQKLSLAIDEFLAEGYVFEYKDQENTTEFQATGADFGLLVDTEGSIRQAMAMGHEYNFFSNLKAQLTSVTLGIDLPLNFSIEGAALNAFLDTAFLDIEKPARQASLAYNNGDLVTISPRSGTEVDREPVIKKIKQLTPHLNNQVIELDLVEAEPEILEKDLSTVRDLADQMLSSNFNLYYDDKNYLLSEDVVASWMEFHSILPEDVLGKSICSCGLPQQVTSNTDEAQQVPSLLVTPFDQLRLGVPETDPYFVMLTPENFTKQNFKTGELMPVVGLNRDRVNHWLLENISADIDRPGQNARLTFINGEVKVAQPSVNGIEVDIEQAARDIVFKITDPESEPTTRLKLAEAKPEINEEIISELGINTLIGQGVSDFSGSPVNRVHNIETGFEKYSGLVIAPGEEFSVVEKLGPVDAAAGFLPELVIVGKKITPQYGGGLCQVSTTIFRAALDTGLPITDRTNHSFAVSYYQWPYAEWGVEATIYDPAPDLKFVNDTEAHILMQAYTTPEGKAYVDFYGTDPGRETTIEGPWRLSGSMASGGTTVFNYIVRDAVGAVLREQEFVSVFQPLAEFKHE